MVILAKLSETPSTLDAAALSVTVFGRQECASESQVVTHGLRVISFSCFRRFIISKRQWM